MAEKEKTTESIAGMNLTANITHTITTVNKYEKMFPRLIFMIILPYDSTERIKAGIPTESSDIEMFR